MRISVFLLIFLFSANAYSQYYISDIAPDSIDQLKVHADSLYKSGKYLEAAVDYGRLKNYWQEETKKPNSSNQIWQNHFFSSIYFEKIESRLGRRKKALDVVSGLQKDIIEKLGATHIINGMSNHELGLIVSEYDFKKALEYTLTALKIREDSLPSFKSDIAWSYNNLGISYRMLGQDDKSLECIQKALEVRLKLDPPAPDMLVPSYLNLSQYYFANGDLEQEINYLEKAHEMSLELGFTHPYNLIVEGALAKTYYRKGDFKKSLALSLSILERKKAQIDKDGEIDLVENYYKIGTSYMNMGFPSKSYNYMDSALQILQTHKIKNTLSLLYSGMARTTKDPKKAIQLFEKAISVCPDDQDCIEEWNAVNYNEISTIHMANGDPIASLNYSFKAVEIYEKNILKNEVNLSAAYHNIGMAYDFIGNQPKAIHYAKKSIQLIEQSKTKNLSWACKDMIFLGKLYADQNDFSNAEKQLLRALKLNEADVGKQAKSTIHNYLSLARLYRKTESYDKAILFSSKALQSEQNKDPINSNRLATVYKNFAEIYRDQNNKELSLSYIQKGFEALGLGDWKLESTKGSIERDYALREHFQEFVSFIRIEQSILGRNQAHVDHKINHGISLIDALRKNYFFETSEIEFQNDIRLFFDYAISQLCDIYELNQDEKTIALIFLCIEKSKTLNLKRSLERIESLDNENVSQEIIEEEKRILYQTEITHKSLLNLDPKNDSLKYVQLSNELFDLQGSQEKFIDSLKSNFPQYYNQRYSEEVISFKDAKALAIKSNRGFLIYYWGIDELFKLTITPSKTTLKNISLELIQKPLGNLLSFLANRNEEEDETDFNFNKNIFIQSSSQVFNQIIGKETLDHLPFNVSIMADGKLLHLPFDVLLTLEAKENNSYKSLDYLIKEKALSYNASFSQYKNRKRQHANNLDSYLGFAPIYLQENNEQTFAKNRSIDSSPLLQNESEIIKTSALFNGHKHLLAEATESNFKKHAGKHDILHLAMHTHVEDSLSIDSYLKFSTEHSNEEDSYLYIYEIAKMHLDAELVVLSSCETNKGKQINGEAVLGIARAFQLASCPNLIFSYWLVDDRSAKEVIYNFFKSFKEGLRPPESLRSSKLDFLQNASTIHSNPAYWAAFSYYGNPDLKLNPTQKLPSQLILVVSTLLILLSFYFFLKK